jgi:flagellar motor switch protein FliM
MPKDDIEHRFAFHAAATEEKRDEHTSIRQTLGRVAVELEARLPVCRETALALTKLEEAMFWANAAAARY